MSQIDFAIPKKIPAGLVEELVKKSVYCSVHLKGLEVLEGGGMVRIQVDDPSQADDVKDKVLRFVAGLLKGYRHFDHKVVFRSEVEPDYTPNAWEELLRRGWVFHCGSGQVGMRGPALALYQYFESESKRMAKLHFNADSCQFPTLISTDTLARCGYFSSFPQAITFTAHLREDFDLIDEFSQANKVSAKLNLPRRDVFKEPEYCLTPVVCYHCYQTLENQVLAAEDTRIFTALSPCFRYESRNMTSLERLWNFNMREIVYVGSRESVKAERQQCMDLVAEWVGRLGLRMHFETASDPFFTTDFSEKTYFQLLSDLKYEMRLNISADRTIAAGSFNLHNDFFGKAFNIASGPGPAFTSCVGFGLERLVFGFICQKGLDPSHWPNEVRHYLETVGA